jgi:acetyl esterase/lipase
MRYDSELEAFVEESRRFNSHFEAVMVASPPDFSTAEAVLRTRETLHAADPVDANQKLPVPPETRKIGSGDGEIEVRLFLPERPRAAYLHFHMGGWVVGTARASDCRNSEIAERCSLAVVSVEYRLAPEWPAPAQLDDALTTVAWLSNEGRSIIGAEEWILGGESAGATLAALLMIQMRDQGLGIERVRGTSLAYGVYDLSATPSQRLSESFLMSGDVSARVYPGRTPEQLRDPTVSPLFADLTGLAPALFSVGGRDGLLDDTLFMAARWEAAGNETTLDVYPESLHGFDTFPTKMAEAARHRMDQFLRSLS